MAKEAAVAQTASTWMQVVFGGLGLSAAIVGAVIAYFAWVQPHSSNDEPRPPASAGNAAGGSTGTASASTAGGTTGIGAGATAGGPAGAGAGIPSGGSTVTEAGRKRIPLRSLAAVTGGGNLRPAGDDLTMPCATGQSTDRQRTIEYDVLAHYAALTTDLTVSKARDGDTPLQVEVFVDDRGAGTYTLTKDGDSRRLDVPLTGGSRLRIQLTCQFPDGEVRFGDPLLTHA